MSATSRVNWRVRATLGLVLALVCLLSTVMFASASGSLGSPFQISSDPYTNPSSQHQTEVEPDTFSYGCTIVSAFQAGRFTDGGASNIGWATSTECSKTWTHGFLPGTTRYASPKGKYARDTDPAVAYDAYHKVWMIAQLVLDPNGRGVAVLVSRSTNGGTVWNNPITVAITRSGNFDKPWIVCDNSTQSDFMGNCYIEYDDNSQGDLIQMTTSHTEGLNWNTPVSTMGNDQGVGGNPVVQPNGCVIVPIDNASLNGAIAFTSCDGGKSWSASVSIANFNSSSVNGGLRAPDLLSAEIDAQGNVYVVWYDCRFEKSCSANNIVMSTSPDGITWSKIQRIPIDSVGSGVDHFLAGIAVDKATSPPNARLGLIYYFYPQANCGQSCQLEVGFVCSKDSGMTWPTKYVLSPSLMQLTWLANTTQGYMVGDYFSASFVSTGKVYPVFMLAKQPGSMFNEAANTSSAGLC